MLTVSHIEAVPEEAQEASTGDLSELLEQVDEMYKPFLVSKDSESGKPQASRSQRLEAQKENSGSPQAARVKTTNIAGWQKVDSQVGRSCMQNILFNP